MKLIKGSPVSGLTTERGLPACTGAVSHVKYFLSCEEMEMRSTAMAWYFSEQRSFDRSDVSVIHMAFRSAFEDRLGLNLSSQNPEAFHELLTVQIREVLVWMKELRDFQSSSETHQDGHRYAIDLLLAVVKGRTTKVLPPKLHLTLALQLLMIEITDPRETIVRDLVSLQCLAFESVFKGRSLPAWVVAVHNRKDQGRVLGAPQVFLQYEPARKVNVLLGKTHGLENVYLSDKWLCHVAEVHGHSLLVFSKGRPKKATAVLGKLHRFTHGGRLREICDSCGWKYVVLGRIIEDGKVISATDSDEKEFFQHTKATFWSDTSLQIMPSIPSRNPSSSSQYSDLRRIGLYTGKNDRERWCEEIVTGLEFDLNTLISSAPEARLSYVARRNRELLEAFGLLD